MGRSISEEVAGGIDVSMYTDIYVDDIFRDLRFHGEEPPSLYEQMQPSSRGLVGSFSKSFVPGLRVGFLAADRPIIEDLMPLKRYMDLGGSTVPQAIMADLLEQAYPKHLEAMRPYYRERRDAMIVALEKALPGEVQFTRPEGGFHLWLRVPRLREVTGFANERGIVTVIDNTLASPVNFRPLAVGFDLVFHSATKYLNGHSDIVAGCVLDPHAAFLMARGIKTLALRVRAQNDNAMAVARFLVGPLLSGFDGMLSLRPKGGAEAARKLLESVRIPFVLRPRTPA